MTAVATAPLRLVTCQCTCPAGAVRAHHDRLLAIDSDVSVLLELMELAITWHELDYSATPVVPPSEWAEFADRHVWVRPEKAEAAFMLALDVWRRSACA